ncbi:MAG TPA: hypothetical protein VLL52_12170 [Anaerolineae bacterium]|nr:hypothetical protein [Anaerolineae bacterium]
MSSDTNLEAKSSQRQKLARGLGLTLIGTAMLIIFWLGVAYLGWQAGQAERQAAFEANLVNEVAHQIELVTADIEGHRYALALRRLEWVEGQAVGGTEVVALRATAQTGLEMLLTPTATPLPPTATPIPPTATPVPPTAIVTPDPTGDFETLVEDLETLKGEEKIEAIVAFQVKYPSYQRLQTERFLYAAYIDYAKVLMQGDNVELGLAYIALAEELGELEEEIKDLQGHGELYVQGRVFYKVNWGAATAYFRDLCFVAPYFHDSCSLLVEALVAHGDLFAESLDWCPAEKRYLEAREYDISSVSREKLTAASEACLEATPTPTVTPTPEFTPTPEGGAVEENG